MKISISQKLKDYNEENNLKKKAHKMAMKEGSIRPKRHIT